MIPAGDTLMRVTDPPGGIGIEVLGGNTIVSHTVCHEPPGAPPGGVVGVHTVYSARPGVPGTPGVNTRSGSLVSTAQPATASV